MQLSNLRGLAAVATALACLLSCVQPANAQAQDQPLPSGESLTISLLTFGPGDRVIEYFGHNAILVESPELSEPAVFNYGMFDFGPGTLLGVVRGRLTFWAGRSTLRQTLALYRSRHREVRVQKLSLEPERKRALFAQLLHDVEPAHRRYAYDHVYDNCSTRVRDVLDRALDGQLRRAWAKPAALTLRQETLRYAGPITGWLMMTVQNASADRPQTQWADAFLPERLEELVDATSYVDSRGLLVPLVAEKDKLFGVVRAAVPRLPPAREPYALALGLALGAYALWLGRRAARGDEPRARKRLLRLATGYGVVFGSIGLVLAHLWLFTDYTIASQNETLWLMSPLTLVAGVLSAASLRRAAWAERGLPLVWRLISLATFAWLLLSTLPLGFEQDLSLIASLLVPANAAIAAAIRSCVPLTAAARD